MTSTLPVGNNAGPPSVMAWSAPAALASTGPLCAAGPSTTEDPRREATRKRAATAAGYKRPYMREMQNAHAEGREPIIEIPVSPEGKVIGMKTPWHRAARLCARQTFNFKIRSYKAKTDYWNSQIELVASKLSSKFIYSNPLSQAYLGKFLRTAMKTDRKQWKSHFIQYGLQHEKCPDEAFREWSKYWVSTAGKEESEKMTEMRSRNKEPNPTNDDVWPTYSAQPSSNDREDTVTYLTISRYETLRIQCCQ